jgi:hypothetical protein
VSRVAITLLIGLATAACAELPPVAADRCGTGVLDPTEDCDVADARCVACSWTCGGDADCTSVPAPRAAAAYRCGVDHLCHAPSGSFAAASTAAPFDAEAFIITDIDRDGIGDVVGLSSTSISTRLGDPTGRLARESATMTPDVTGPASVADVDGDGALDYVVPTGDGLVAMASLNHVVAPYALGVLPPAIFGSLTLLAQFKIDNHHIGLLVATAGGTLLGLQLDPSRVPPTIGLLGLCGSDLSAASFAPGSVQSYDTSAASPGVVVTFVADNGAGQPVLCALSVLATGNTITNTAYALPARASSAMIDLAGDGCPSVVVATPDLGALAEYPGVRSGGTCVLDASNPVAMKPMPSVRPGSTLIGSLRLRPQPAGVQADALVTTYGIFGIGANAYPAYYTSDRAITSIQAGDLDADGALDAAVTGPPRGQVDLLYRVGSPPGFLRIRLGSGSAPGNLLIDDFDGDGVDDVTFTTRLEGAGHPLGDQLNMIYGARARTPVIASVGQLYGVLGMTPTRLLASNNPSNTIADLTVFDTRPISSLGGGGVVEEFFGSPQRALIPFVDPDSSHTSTFLGVVAGRFLKPPNVDLVAFNVPRIPTGATAGLWVIPGDGPGQIDIGGSSRSLSNVGSCEGPLDGFCLDTARLVAWPGDKHDVVLAIDPIGGHAMVIDPDPMKLPSGCGGMVTMPCVLQLGTGPITAGSIAMPPFVADSDGDGVPELIFGATTAAGGSIQSCQVDVTNMTMPLRCIDLAQLLPDLGRACSLAAPGRVGRDGADGIVIACGADVYAISHDPGGYHATALLTLSAAPSLLGLGDVTGDAIDDLVVIETTTGAPQVVVYPQLTSREAP